ncbi:MULTISPECIES: tetratricopeptide repeat protein [unclassified Nitratiruptor]|uniref:tetratricopeptide repeat protein n=1 Tax=unclassified Nitratiruptor TaxID=2624044 RepID=UPI001916957B|nr:MULTISPECIES: tetratricopeptide repeat protein [unclassified Nitratiruptor]BCD61137.1 hypothetical protein NitYY0810_C1922 [Nitratiruptor sp. YY08-10]BCD65070.1 hypothetical protein NitYY0814_C1931 [Nitratiruptor sp. YY08-14]
MNKRIIANLLCLCIPLFLTGCAQKVHVRELSVPVKNPDIRYLDIKPFANDRFGFRAKLKKDLLQTYINGKPFFHIGPYPTKLLGSIHTTQKLIKNETRTKNLCLAYKTKNNKQVCIASENIPYECSFIRLTAYVHIVLLSSTQTLFDRDFSEYETKKICNEPKLILDTQKVIQTIHPNKETVLIKNYKVSYPKNRIDPYPIYAKLLQRIEKRVYYAIAPHFVSKSIELPTTINGKKCDSMEKVADLADEGKYTQALQLLQQLKKKYPNSYEIYFAQGAIFEALGDKQKALQKYQYACRINPNPACQSRIESIKNEFWLSHIISSNEDAERE